MSTAAVVLGFGAAVDREIAWDAVVLADLAQHHGIGPADLVGAGPIRTERDLVASVLGYLGRGAGGERRVDEPEVITRFSDRFAGVTSLGGTCVRAAAAMGLLGRCALVHLAFVDDEVLALLPPGAAYLVGDSDEASYPHLIVQYPAGARVRTDRLDLVAPRANRLIYVNDPANERLLLSDDLTTAVAGAAVFLVSGLNAIRTGAQLRDRLDRIEASVAAARPDSLVCYEDAGYHEPELAAVVRSRMARLVDVYSLSDEELAALLGRPIDLLDAADVLDAVSTLAGRVDVPVVVVHSRHWALAFGAPASHVEPALATGVALATTRYAFGSAASPADVRTVRHQPVDDATSRFLSALAALGGSRVAAAAVPTVDVESPTTVGLGDTFIGGFLAECAASASIRTAVSRRSP
ncbi:MAG TPA: ADP-dependent glucokinase/phosphofructokinase [Intrasporangium sp.]|uniref:ADP-dependent glucokinase/phosphofructokinase n=1 Tax=Intrasporangium sp. TaxID=1925024 RepID=UPI002D765794|nr:ADP-dependent glucokinase/phosphofructokinase [Intrasporangium sp.]HET7398353.1 ADP-dependent glucokinase/phosphofructokinase [Intrasporangium sp.]